MYSFDPGIGMGITVCTFYNLYYIRMPIYLSHKL